jgi:hypothetical protein
MLMVTGIDEAFHPENAPPLLYLSMRTMRSANAQCALSITTSRASATVS